MSSDADLSDSLDKPRYERWSPSCEIISMHPFVPYSTILSVLKRARWDTNFESAAQRNVLLGEINAILKKAEPQFNMTTRFGNEYSKYTLFVDIMLGRVSDLIYDIKKALSFETGDFKCMNDYRISCFEAAGSSFKHSVNQIIKLDFIKAPDDACSNYGIFDQKSIEAYLNIEWIK
ncbi:uncharacterized protein [Prorops nasuta]|uniref:uncharacterized protein n=1 Tax=Prorops nasuta TaxID=863751 RepID=UPI0034CDD9FB